jgi:hypothetical protein
MADNAAVPHVAMEATGVYWKPVWSILGDGDFELVLANAAHIKNVPGRKTDVNDAMWIADLMACGLIRASFVPDEAIQQLRSLQRARKQLTRDQTRQTQRIQKTLEEANIKLDSVLSDIMGVSGRKMIEAMIEGLRNPTKLAVLADRRLKATPKELYDALHGRLTDHHRFMLKLYLGQYDALDKAVIEIDQAVDAGGHPHGRGGGGGYRPLSIPDRPSQHHARRQHPVGHHHPGGDRDGHAPLRHSRTFGGMGRDVPRPERERRQAKVLAPTQRRALVENHAGPMRLGGCQKEGQLLPRTVQSTKGPGRREKGHLRRRRLHAHRRSKMALNTTTSAQITSTGGLPCLKPSASSANSTNSVST